METIIAGMSGLSIAAIVLLSIVCVILALALVKHTSVAAATKTVVGDAEADWKAALAKLGTWEPKASGLLTEAEKYAARGVDIVEHPKTELQSMLAKAEAALLDTSNEDAIIERETKLLEEASVNTATRIAAAKQSKADKIAAAYTHITNLQTALAPPAPAAPADGS